MNIQSDSKREGLAKRPNRWGLAIAGVLGALAGTLALHSLVPAFTLPDAFVVMPESPSADLLLEYKAAYQKMAIGNASSGFGIIGACLALPLGVLVFARSRIASALKATVLAGAGGVVGGSAAGFVVFNGAFIEGRQTLPIYGLDPMLLSVFIQFAGWGAAGLGLGIALTCCRPGARVLEGISWGLAGGFLAAIAFAVISSIAFPSSALMQAVPASLSERLIWAGCAGLCLGSCMIPLIRKPEASTKEHSAPRE